MNAEKFDRLPKWAREHIALLERQLNETRTKVVELQASLSGDGGSPFTIEHGLRADDQTLPSSAKHIGWSHEGFELRLSSEGDQLRVACTSWHGVAVVPQASNVVNIRPGRIR